MGKRRGKIVFFIVLLGGIIGAILGHVLKDIVPILDKGLKVGTDSLSFNLYLIDISFGIHINITLSAIIGLLIAFLLADVGRRRS
jgi:fluoride ion exporter CrcB/FEX